MCKFKTQFIVAILTFGISVAFTTAVIFPTQIPKVEVTDNSVIETVNLIETIGEIEIKYETSNPRKDDSDEAIFLVKNNTNKSVYYFGNHVTNNQNSWVKQNGKIKYIEPHRGAEITEQELKPTESTYFWIPAPQNKKPFEAGFVLRLGEKRKEQTILVKVRK